MHNSSSHNCIFCKIIQGSIPATIIARNNNAIAINDIAPKAPIHYLIIPHVHVADITQLTPDQFSIGSSMFALAHEIGSQLPNKQHFRLIINNGANVGQSVFHLHMHLLAGMNNPGLTDIE